MWVRPLLVIFAVVVLSACAPANVATWDLDGPVSEESTELEILVTRAECSSGVTGAVLEPQVTYEADRIVVTAYVEPLDSSAQNCPGNDAVPLLVHLSEPVQDRPLVDAFCLNPDVAEYVWCHDSDGVRWEPADR